MNNVDFAMHDYEFKDEIEKIFDITQKKSFESVESFHKVLTVNEPKYKILVGNKKSRII